jgi:alkanesulfonate monooxygenase SsuD/methylene tetrahydromethanopterin reductase-like flavin-dependent oxidoreductase (luciferase family)
MKVDLFLMPDIPHPRYLEMARLADASGCENLWVIDGQDVFPDPWVTASLCAISTTRIRVGPGVTNPLTRHPRVTANAMLTIHELSGGRGILGMGAGDNAVRTLGWKPARVSAVREAVDICRQMFRERRAEIPIYVAGGGPRLNAYACEAADGIIVPAIGTAGDLRRVLGRVEVAARETGRDFRAMPVLIYLGLAISHDRREALDDARGGVARRVLNFVYYPNHFPPELEPLRGEVEALASGYRYADHLKTDVPHARLVSDTLLEVAGIAGTPAEVLAKLQALGRETAGLNATFFLRPDGPGKQRSFELFVREVWPALVAPRVL